MAAEASRSGGPADSYIGSLISLTSKSEIRYEGVLYNINTEESSIGLRNVRSFGTEGRKKDGLQVPPNDKVYEYILFRGSDIKDLQVKSSPTVQPTPPIHNDPAIIQSHYSHPAPVSTTLPAAGSGPVTEIGSQTAQLGLPRSTFQGGLPLYQPGGNLASWGSSPPPPSANGTGLAMPMYWQGFYGPPSGLPPHMQQQSLLRPPPGLSMPHSMQQQPMQFPGMSTSMQPTGASNLPTSNLVDFPPPLLPPVSSGPLNLTSSTLASNLPSTLASAHSAALASETSPSLITTKAPIAAFSTATSSASLPLVSPLTTSSLDKSATSIPPTSNKPKTVPGPSLPYQTVTQSVSSTVGTSSSSSHHGASTPLVTPGKLLQPGPTTLSSSQSSQPTRPTTLSASQSSQPAHKDVVVVQVSSSQTLPSASTELQAPILPLPSLPDQKPSRAPLHTHHNHGYRGRERGRGNGISRPVTKFTEEFDFIAMNEKFKKDEVWGHLGKSNKAQFRDKQGDGNEDDEDYPEDEDYTGPSKSEEKPVYVKDDFFDTLSSNALDNASRAGRTKFSEQMKIDSETFGDFPRHNRGGRGGRGGPGRGGRSWNPHYGRGYGYVGRGRGRNMPGRGY